MSISYGSSIHLARARELLDQRRYDASIVELQQHLASFPDDPFAHAYMARALSHLDREKEALEWAERAIGLGPDIGYCHYVRAIALVNLDRYKDAEAAVMEALRLEPDNADFYCYLGMIRCAQANWPGALQAAETGLSIDAEHVGCANVRARALTRQGKTDHAEVVIQSALEKDPENAYTHANQGWIALRARDRDRAMAHFTEALRLDPTLDQAREGVLEVLRTRYPVYRAIYAYYEWMAGFSRSAGRGIVIGIWVVFRILRTVAASNPALAPVVLPISLLYGLFVFLSWTGRSTFDLLLRFHPLGRLALSRSQVAASNGVGLCLLGALAGACVGAGLHKLGATVTEDLSFILLALPWSSVSYIKRPDITQKTCVVLYVANSLLTVCALAIPGSPDWISMLSLLFIAGLAIYSWVRVFRRR